MENKADKNTLNDDFQKRKVFKGNIEEIKKELGHTELSMEGKKNYYLERIEREKDKKTIFKYVYLFNSAALDSYIAQTRKQAHESFKMAKKISIAGFILIAIGVLIGFILLILKIPNSEFIAGLTAGSGVVAEIISGVIFVLFNKTLKQFNVMIDKITEGQINALNVIEKEK